jgi:DNA replication protein DnaC
VTTTYDFDLDALFKRLHLANARRVWRDLCRRAQTEQWTFEHFLGVLVAEEVAHRAKTRIDRVSRKAELPFIKTIDEFDFTFQSTLQLSMMGSFLSPDFVFEGRSLILSGKTGRGKTHLAVAIAYRAIQNGFHALFTTCAALIDDLSAAASHKGRFREALARYVSPDVLVIDEVGYLSYGPDAANVLFHVVNGRHVEKRPMVFTTNKPLSAWGTVLHDPDLAEVLIDRVLERGRHIKLDGPSVRAHHLGLDNEGVEGQKGVRVSGTGGSDFPETTLGKKDTAPWVCVVHPKGSNDGVERRLNAASGASTRELTRWRCCVQQVWTTDFGGGPSSSEANSTMVVEFASVDRSTCRGRSLPARMEASVADAGRALHRLHRRRRTASSDGGPTAQGARATGTAAARPSRHHRWKRSCATR